MVSSLISSTKVFSTFFWITLTLNISFEIWVDILILSLKKSINSFVLIVSAFQSLILLIIKLKSSDSISWYPFPLLWDMWVFICKSLEKRVPMKKYTSIVCSIKMYAAPQNRMKKRINNSIKKDFQLVNELFMKILNCLISKEIYAKGIWINDVIIKVIIPIASTGK